MNNRYLSYLKWAFLVSYLLVVCAIWLWNGPTILFLSIFLLGLPLLGLLLPLAGVAMFTAKKEWSVILLYLITLPSPLFCLYLIFSSGFPLRKMITEAGHYEELPASMAWFLISSLLAFLLISTLSVKANSSRFEEW